MARFALLLLGLAPLLVSAAPTATSFTVNEPAALGKRWGQSNYPFSVAALTVETDDDTIYLFSPLLGTGTLSYTASLGDADGWYPLTVFATNATSVGCDTLSNLVASYKAQDDVWSEVFLGASIIASTAPITTAANTLESCFENSAFVLSAGAGGYGVYLNGETPPPGPYFAKVSSGSLTLYRVYRSYRDENQAFTEAVYETSSSPLAYAALSLNVPGMNTLSVGVPSRLYYTKTADKPLAGLRYGLKDIFDASGLRTGDGNRAYELFYPPRTASWVGVERLASLGAVLVGKTKASQFANGETATADWVDQLEPFNPRGDGYQDTSSSSSGSGASIGAYDWLDFSIGSDTGGSIRGPAGVQGIYGLRPSTGAIDLTNVMPLSHQMDTAGGFARDAASFSLVHKSLYGDHFKSYPNLPKKLIVASDEFPTGDDGSDAIFTSFIDKLTTFLNATVSNQTIEGLWNSSGYYEQYGRIGTYLNLTYPTLISYDQYTNFSGPWIRAYQAANDGRVPFVDPVPLVRWQFGIAQGEAGYANATTEREIFANFTNTLLLPSNDQTCSDALYVYAQAYASPSYRNEYFDAPKPPTGFSSGRVANFAGCPEGVVPIGQAPYNSTITNHTEVLPVALSVIAHRDCDYVVLDLFSALADAGLTKGVMVGKTSF